jgi:hypothetical protein
MDSRDDHGPYPLNVEAFTEQHPAMDGETLSRFARTAQGHHEPSPRAIDVATGDIPRTTIVTFATGDPRTPRSFQRPVVVEYGAVVLSGLLLSQVHSLQLTRVTCRGSRVDYFVGRAPQNDEGVIEVGGTDSDELSAVLARKTTQLRESPYLRPPFSKPGYVGVVRFASRAAVRVESVQPERVPA